LRFAFAARTSRDVRHYVGVMDILQRALVASIAASIGFQSAIAQMRPKQEPSQLQGTTTKEVLTDAAIILVIIAGSIAAYKAMDKPCACPADMMRNGRRCGGNSAWARPGGFKPLCYSTDVTETMIKAYRATKTIPLLR
jgi:hypothetical protein